MKLKLALISFVLIINTLSSAQTLTFNVQPTTYSGEYSPDHCLAVWITDSLDNFVKTLDRHGAKRSKYLFNWIDSNPAQNVLDASTGATINNYSSSPTPYFWNCTNVVRKIVPAGKYFLNIEITEQNGAGKYMKYPITLGTKASLIIPNSTTGDGLFFKNATIEVPNYITTPLTEMNIINDLELFYQQESKLLHIKSNFEFSSKFELSIFNSQGHCLLQKQSMDDTIVISLSDFLFGMYIAQIKSQNGFSQTLKFVVH